MSGANYLRDKITSIKKTQKTTSAMEMVAASKMKRAQQLKEQSKPYAKNMRAVIGHVARSHSEYRHPYMKIRPVKRIGLIIVSTDRGLCGGLNINLFRTIVAQMKAWEGENIAIDLCIIGKKGEAFFKRFSNNILGIATQLGDRPGIQDVIGVVSVMLDAYDREEIDGLYIASNEFINTMKQQPTIEQLLPLPPVEDDNFSHYWDYIYEPDARELLDILLTRYIESQVYQAVVENLACQQAATMVAMKSATDNATEFIKELQKAYNKVRQASITQEIAEIVSGAAAVE